MKVAIINPKTLIAKSRATWSFILQSINPYYKKQKNLQPQKLQIGAIDDEFSYSL